MVKYTNYQENMLEVDAPILRWIGFRSGDTVVVAKWEGKDGNTWKGDFVSMGEQKIALNTPEEIAYNFTFEGGDETLSKILQLIRADSKMKKEFEEFVEECGGDETKMVSTYLSHLLERGNKCEATLAEAGLLWFCTYCGILQYVFSCWLEPYYTVTDKNGNILLEDYASNMVLGDGVYYTIKEVMETLDDENSRVECVEEQYAEFLKKTA